MRQWTIALLAAILVSGCAPSQADNQATPAPTSSATAGPTGSPAPSPSSPEEPPVTLPQVTVMRTGGLAGMNDQWVVHPDGTISVESRRKPPSTPKKLTADEQTKLSALLAAPALRAEAAAAALAKRTCADGFVYTLSAAGVTAHAMDCGTLATDAPTMWKIVTLVQGAATRP